MSDTQVQSNSKHKREVNSDELEKYIRLLGKAQKEVRGRGKNLVS